MFSHCEGDFIFILKEHISKIIAKKSHYCQYSLRRGRNNSTLRDTGFSVLWSGYAVSSPGFKLCKNYVQNNGMEDPKGPYDFIEQSLSLRTKANSIVSRGWLKPARCWINNLEINCFLTKKFKPNQEKPPRSDDSLLKKSFITPVRHSKDDSQFLYT